jgi:hypothetical protein
VERERGRKGEREKGRGGERETASDARYVSRYCGVS